MCRLTAVLLALLTTFSLLGACSSSDDDTSSDQGGEQTSTDDSSPSSGSSADEDAVATEAVTIEHEYGTTEVPADPQAIAALGEEFLLADLFDLGLGDRVTLTTSTVGDLGPVEALGYDVEGIEVHVPQEADIEDLLASEPDLILAQPYVVEEVGYDVLSGIAPTIPLLQDDWKANYQFVADAFGPQVGAHGEEQLTSYDDAVVTAGEELGAADRTVSVATVYSGANLVAWAEGPIDAPATLLDMGFTLAPNAEDGDPDTSGRIQLSLEQIGLLDGEDLVLLQTSAVEGEDVALADITDQTLWQRLPAVEADRAHTVDRLGYPGLPGRMALIEVLQQELAR